MAETQIYGLTEADVAKLAKAIDQITDLYGRVINLRVTGARAFHNSPAGIAIDVSQEDGPVRRWLGIVTEPSVEGGIKSKVKRAYTDGETVTAFEGQVALEVEAVQMEAVRAAGNSEDFLPPQVDDVVMVYQVAGSEGPPVFLFSSASPALGVGDPWTRPKYAVDGVSGQMAIQTEHLAPVIGSPRDGVDDITLIPSVGGVITYTPATEETPASATIHALQIDTARHVVGVGEAVAFPVFITLAGHDPWITVAFNAETKVWTIEHAGPNTVETPNVIGFADAELDTGVITWTGGIGEFDSRGHFRALQEEPNTFTFAVKDDSADWLDIAAGVGGGAPDATIEHLDPAAESYETAKVTDMEVVADGSDWVLRVSFLPASVDAKGHVRDNTEATEQTLDLPLVEIEIQKFEMDGINQVVRLQKIWVPKVGTLGDPANFIEGTDCEE